MKQLLLVLLATPGSMPLLAADAIGGEVERQPVNTMAIIMFVSFVIATLGITYWAARRTRSAKDFYAAGGGITGFQNAVKTDEH